MGDAAVDAVNYVAEATGLPVAAVLLVGVSIFFSALVMCCRAPASASSDAGDAPELEDLGNGTRRVDSLRTRTGRYVNVAPPPTASTDDVQLLEQPARNSKRPASGRKPGRSRRSDLPRPT